LFLAILVSSVVGQTLVDKITIDNYEDGDQVIPIVLNSSLTSGNISATSFFTSAQGVNSNDILGGERDLQYTAESGSAGRVFSTSISVVNGSGEWQISTPNGGSGVVLAQYDGIDNSIALNVKGFGAISGANSQGGIDLTQGGTTTEFSVVVQSDQSTSYSIFAYGPDGTKCTNSFDVPQGNIVVNSQLTFTSFTGTCSFSNIGALEIYVQAFANVDTLVSDFKTEGTNPTTPTATITPSPGALPSNSPSPSSPPSRAVAPSQGECYCFCPAFTCELVFDPDDDENNAYFFVSDDGFARSKGYFGGYGFYYAGQNRTNDASSLVVSVFTILTTIIAFF